MRWDSRETLGAREYRQLAHPQSVVWLLGQGRQDVVLEEAQVGVTPQLPAQGSRQGREDKVQRRPRLQFVGRKPRGLSRQRCFFGGHDCSVGARDRHLKIHVTCASVTVI